MQLALAEAAAIDQLEIVDAARLPARSWSAFGDIEPGRNAADVGVVAAADATQNRIDLASLSSNTGVQTVMSGRCVPPL